MTSQISAIYAAIAGVSVTAASKTPTVYYGATAVDNVEAYGLPARLLLPTFSQSEGRGAKFVSVSPGNMMVAQWRIADLCLWQEVGLGSGVDAFVAALVEYSGAYLDAFKAYQKLVNPQITLEQIDVSPDVYEYPVTSNRWYAGVLCTLLVKEIIS